ncbi:hypothetical protein WJX84_009093 [Apatococcus fuscideae]|uniref:Uncharacterized protein n=1 Tax=Apatococcus fuscideae TaxID=2026836 RepID=A0AAW1T2Q9_9CHLO
MERTVWFYRVRSLVKCASRMREETMCKRLKPKGNRLCSLQDLYSAKRIINASATSFAPIHRPNPCAPLDGRLHSQAHNIDSLSNSDWLG